MDTFWTDFLEQVDGSRNNLKSHNLGNHLNLTKTCQQTSQAVRSPRKGRRGRPKKKVTMYQDGTRRKSLFKRVGRPRTKWHTVTRKHTIKQLIEKRVILPNWNFHMRDPELDNIIIQAASDRKLWQTLSQINDDTTTLIKSPLRSPRTQFTKSSPEAPYAGQLQIAHRAPVRGSA